MQQIYGSKVIEVVVHLSMLFDKINYFLIDKLIFWASVIKTKFLLQINDFCYVLISTKVGLAIFKLFY